ncbi:MAG: ABC transporter permease [Methanomicrobiales archaeon]|nr:ABC transporter permease [Methanomicrobiales archaeon]
MSYLLYVAVLGTAGVSFLYLRDLRIYGRTGLKGYRKAAMRGVLYSALSLLGLFFALYGSEIIGLGLILGALYLQGRVAREKIWTDEKPMERFFGKCRCKKDKGGK